jgi:UDP-glucose 4-epimerase
VPLFVAKALRGEPLTIAGDGSQFRQFVYVEDLAEGNVLALKPIAQGKIYNLDGTEHVTIRQIAEAVQRIVGRVAIESIPARPADFAGKEVSSRLAREELGWEPTVRFEEGLRRYIVWYREQLAKVDAAWAKLDDALKPDVNVDQQV